MVEFYASLHNKEANFFILGGIKNMRRMYSENQLVKVLEDKDVVVNTISQSKANKEFTTYTLSDSITFDNGYIGCKVINGLLCVIVSARFKIVSSIQSSTELITFTLDEDTMNKLSVITSAFNPNTISSEIGTYQITGQGISNFGYLFVKSGNNLKMITPSAIGGSAGNYLELSIRTYFALI